MSASAVPQSLRKFASIQPEVEAVLQRIGDGTWDLVAIDVDGNWTRWVFPSDAVARSACTTLGIPVHDGWEEPRMARRMNGLDAWATPGAKRRAL